MRCSDREQAVEESPVTAQSLTQVLGGYSVTPGQFLLKLGSFPSKRFRQLLDSGGDKLVRLLHRYPRVIHKASLDPFPAGSHISGIILRQKGPGIWVFRRTLRPAFRGVEFL